MTSIASKNKVIVAPLNWGWGHASRCIPIINTLKNQGLVPVIATDGDALEFLQKEFSELEVIILPSYNINYGKNLKMSLVLNLPRMLYAIRREQQVLKKYISEHKNEVLGLISDNRLGAYSKEITSIYITHQLNIKANKWSGLVNRIHHYFIKKHRECWLPDVNESKCSGELSKPSNIKTIPIGLLSRFKKQELPKTYDLLVLLSGVVSQRNALEAKIVSELKHYEGSVLLVRGTFKERFLAYPKHMKVVPYLLSKELEIAINSSKNIITRSGYSSIMDMVVLGKKAFYIPTPQQTEQEYLAERVKELGLGATCTQKDFSLTVFLKFLDCDFNVFETPQKDFLAKEIARLFTLVPM